MMLDDTTIKDGSSAAENKGWLASSVIAFLDRRVLVIVGALLFCAIGVWAFITLRIDAVPDISNIQVTVTTNARGLAPSEVEQYITFPVELALQSLPKLKIQRSISKYGLSQVTTVFEDGTDIYWARQQVSEKLKQAQEQMPTATDIKMSLGPIATGLGEVFQFEVRGSGYSLMQLRDILDWQIIPSLRTVPGIDEIQSMGGEAKEYQVMLSPERMHGYQVTVAEVIAALSRNNANAGGGYAIEQSDQIILRAEGMLTSTRDIEESVIRRNMQGVVRVKDVGKAIIGKKLAQSVVTENGKGETVIGIVIMRKGENSKRLVQLIETKLNQIEKTLPMNVSIRTFYSRGMLIERTIETVWHNLFFGAFFVLVVLFALLGSIRGGIIAALAIPLSLFGSIVFLTVSGTSANLLSLGALDFGILIDGSVVMIENIVRRMAHASVNAQNRLGLIKDAACEVATPVLFAVMIIMVVYFPILGLPGVSGKTFQPMALTVVFGLLTALAIGLYLTPSLAYFLLEKQPREKDSFLMRLVRNPYRRVLQTCTRHPIAVGLASISLFVASLLCLPSLGSEFIPVLKEGSAVLTVSRPVSGSLLAAKAQTLSMEKTLKQIPEVQTVVSRTGHSEIAFDPMGPDETDTFVILQPPSQWRPGVTQQAIENEIARSLRDSIPGLVFSMSQPIEQRMNELVAGAKGDVAIRVFGPNLDKLRDLGSQIKAAIEPIKGSSEIKLEQTSGLPLLTAKLNPTALAAYGVMGQDALDTLSTAVDGKVVGAIFEGRPRYSLTVRFAPDAISTPEDIRDLPVAVSSGNLVPLGQLATVKRSLGSAQIAHVQGERTYMVQVNVRDRDLGGYVNEAQKAVNSKIVLPIGYRIEWGGQFENMQEAQSSLIFLVPLALILIFILLYGLYNNLKPGLLIFLNVPLAFSGGIFGLMARGMPLSVTAGVGFIALFGVAVLNGVVLVSTIRGLEREQQMHPRQAAMNAAMQRLRPVLMTALVASLGFVPMAMASSVGAEVQRPLATVVISGLFTSTLLTLLVIPSFYPLICSTRRRRNGTPLKKLASNNGISAASIKFILAFAMGWGALDMSVQASTDNPPAVAQLLPQLLTPTKSADQNMSSPPLDHSLQPIALSAAFDESIVYGPRASSIRALLGISRATFAQALTFPNPSAVYLHDTAQLARQVGASIPIEAPWKLVLRLSVAKAQIKQTDLEIQRALWIFRGTVRRSYLDAVLAKETVASLEELQILSKTLYLAAKRRLEVGDAAILDVSRAELARLQTEADLAQARRRFEQATQRLAILMGRSYKSKVDVGNLPKFLLRGESNELLPDLAKPAPDLDNLVTKALKERLDVKLVAQRIAVVEASIRNVNGNILPNTQLNVGYSFSGNPPTGPATQGHFLGVTQEIPLLNIQQGERTRLKATRVQLGRELESTRNIVIEEVANTYQQLMAARERISYYQNQILSASDRVASLARRGYEAGHTDITTTLIAQQSNVQTRLSYLEAIRSYQQAVTDLEQSISTPIDQAP